MNLTQLKALAIRQSCDTDRELIEWAVAELEKHAVVGQQWFSYDPDDGFTTYKSEDEALEAGKEYIQSWLHDGWAEEVEHVCVGVVTLTATKTNERKRPDALDEYGYDEEGQYWDADWDYICNYELLPVGGEEKPK